MTPLPTTFFHLVRMWRGNARAKAKRPGCDVLDLTYEVDQAIAHRDAQPAPDHASLHAAARRCRRAQRAYADEPTSHNAMVIARDAAAELDAALKVIERQSVRDQAREQAHRKPEPVKRQGLLFAEADEATSVLGGRR